MSTSSQLARYDKSIPPTIVNWLRATRRPRIPAGDISAIYIGESIEATPTASPPINRAKINSKNVLGRAERIADMAKNRAAAIRIFFLPNLSLNIPAILAPMIHPIKRLLTANPS